MRRPDLPDPGDAAVAAAADHLEQMAPRTDPSHAGAAERPPAPVRVVVCDDAPDVRALVRATLELDGDAQVVGEAGDGEAAVALVAAVRCDVVVLDLCMPRADGLAALPRIRVAAPRAGVVVLSGRDAATTGPEVLALGAARFVAKPTGAAAIRAAVLEVGRRYAAAPLAG